MPQRILYLFLALAVFPVLNVLAQTSNPSPQASPTPSAKYFIDLYTVPARGPGAERVPEKETSKEATATPANLWSSVCPAPPGSDGASKPTAPTKADANKLVARIGNPIPFLLEAPDKDTILIYSSQKMAKTDRRLKELRRSIDDLVNYLPPAITGPNPTPFNVELFVPHAAYIEDRLLARLNPDFGVVSMSSGRMRITATKQPSCQDWKRFLSDLRRLAWQIRPESRVTKLYYLGAPEVGGVIAGGGSSPTPSSPPAANTAATPGPSSAAAPAPAGAASAAAPATTPAAPASVAGSAAPSAASTAAPASATKPAADSSPTTAKISALGSDIVVFNKSGDDVDEKKRIIALMDLPRPEMIVNAWVMQNSSKNPHAINVFDTIVQETVTNFNRGLETAVFEGWSSLKEQTAKEGFFDEAFKQYITYRYLGKLERHMPATPNEAAQQILDLRWDAENLTSEEEDKTRESEKVCGIYEYCLGYNTLFDPIKPRLTDLLIAVVAAKKPYNAATTTVSAMELHVQNSEDCKTSESAYCRALRPITKGEQADCRMKDLIEMYNAARHDKTPPLFLRCFLEKASAIRGVDEKVGDPHKSKLGLLRAAIADFLFHYKLSQQYPHEFPPYELSRSADTLNAALSPFIEGFNADLKAYQDFLRADLKYRIDNLPGRGGWFPWTNKESFINNGIVSVRTISGQSTSLSTTSQSFLDTSAAPSISNLAAAITGENPTLGTDNRPTGILGNLTLNQAQFALGALKAYQSSSAQIGRLLSLNFSPRSLATASSAEITVNLQAGESASPTYFSGPKAGTSADISRVATHDTSTRIRVDSIKLFAVSSFSGELRKSRSRIPLLPLPLLEVPYIGSLVGIPLPSAKEYHTSTAIMSAIVVPTAADLAYGLAFINDRLGFGPVADESSAGASDWTKPGNWQTRRAVSLRDFREQPIIEFHRKKISCFANSNRDCGELKFQNVPKDADDRQ